MLPSVQLHNPCQSQPQVLWNAIHNSPSCSPHLSSRTCFACHTSLQAPQGQRCSKCRLHSCTDQLMQASHSRAQIVPVVCKVNVDTAALRLPVKAFLGGV